MDNTWDLTPEGRVQRKTLRFEFLSNEGLFVYWNSLSPRGGTALSAWKPIFQKELKGHDIRSCHDDESSVRHVLLTWCKEENYFLRAVTRDIRAESVLVERAVTSLADGLYKATSFCQIRAAPWLQGPSCAHLVLPCQVLSELCTRKTPCQDPGVRAQTLTAPFKQT